jgi:formate dehydrogenase
MEAAKALHSAKLSDEEPSVPQEALLSLLLRLTGQGSFESLLEERHGRLREDHTGGDFLGKRVTTDDGRIDLAPPVLVAQAADRLEPTFAREIAGAERLKLITRRQVTTHNSWTHNLDGFVEGERDTNYLYVHPEDLTRLGLSDGDVADVQSATATVRLAVRALDDLMPGTVALPHGWGHQSAKGLSIASRTRGVNVNLLAADGPDNLEWVSGMAHLTGIPVDVRPAGGPRDPSHWSGLPAVDRAAE